MSNHPSGARAPGTVVAALVVLALIALSAAGEDLSTAPRRPSEVPPEWAPMSFARIEYSSVGGLNEAYYYYEGRYWARWETDYPQADENFLFRLEELTTVHPHPEAVSRRLTDDELFDFPLIYMCDVGWMNLEEDEQAGLREYLLKGGFLWVDDFWGPGEWTNLEIAMRQVLPGRTWEEIPNDHPIYQTVYPLDELPQVPARDFAYLGHDPPEIHRYPYYPVTPAHLRGYFDDDGRLMVLATHNTDLGDGWEREGYGEWYFEKYSTVAYAIGANIVVYALTH
jgi:hypothetical protein